MPAFAAASRPRRRLLAAAVALVVPLAAAPVALAGDWTVAEIDGSPGIRWIQPNAVNAHGVVVGTARFPGRSENTAFRWEDGQMIELQTGGATHTTAFDISDRGTIVGYLGGLDTGAVWTATRTTSTLHPTAFNISGRWGSAAYGINEAGTISGSAGDTGWFPAPFEDRSYDNRFPALGNGGGWSRIFIPPVYREDGSSRSISIAGGDAMQVNESGQVLLAGINMGGRARLVGGGSIGEPMELIPGNQGFNDAAQTAGRSPGDSNRGPFSARVWTGSALADVGAAQDRSRANAINNLGWVVGRAGTEDWQAEYRQLGNAWLWRLDGEAAPLAVLGPTGWSYANALDVNDDGVIVGVGKHGSREVGFMMTPSSIAHRVSGTVVGFDGAPVAGARVQVVGGAGQDLTPSLVTGADGRYETTLNRGTYRITILPEGSFAPNAGAGCEITGVTCTLGLRQNRVVDFLGIRAPDGGPRGPGGPGDRARDRDRTPPAIRGPRAGATVAATRAGVVAIGLGPFAEAASGTVTLQQAGGASASASASASARRGGGKKRAKKRSAAVVLGRRSYRAAARRAVVVKVTLTRAARRVLAQRGRIRAVAVVVASDAAGNTATKRIALTVRSAARAAKPRRGRR